MCYTSSPLLSSSLLLPPPPPPPPPAEIPLLLVLFVLVFLTSAVGYLHFYLREVYTFGGFVALNVIQVRMSPHLCILLVDTHNSLSIYML